MNDVTKTCTKCKSVFPATLEYFYKNKGGKYGVTPRCKPCVNEDNKAGFIKRKSENPQKIAEQANNRTKRHYHSNIEKSRERARLHARKRLADPEKRAIIYARKRGGSAGLTPEQLDQMLTDQDHKCAICLTPDPTDLDHCHSTNKVRFLLCNHCNRGLGAFRDNPLWLRKAADLLERFNDFEP